MGNPPHHQVPVDTQAAKESRAVPILHEPARWLDPG
jgi:hypothetical protein